MPATQERNKAAMRRMLEAFNTGDGSVVKELLHPDIIGKSRRPIPGPPILDQPAFKKVQAEMQRERTAFPDQKYEEVSMVAEGDRVVLHWQMTGTHKGEFLGKAGTGKKVKTFGTEFVRFKAGKMIEHDDTPFHILDLLWQLGMLTPDVLAGREFR